MSTRNKMFEFHAPLGSLDFSMKVGSADQFPL
jgi:hypothetical protein